MTVAELKRQIANMPDDSLVVISTSKQTSNATAAAGYPANPTHGFEEMLLIWANDDE